MRALERDGLSNEKVAGKLRRYVRRMATRSTPFGLFAGVGIAQWDTRTALSIGPLRGRTRPGMDLLAAIVSDLESDSEIVRQVSVIANPAAVQRGGRIFVWGSRGDERGEHSSRFTPAVAMALESASRPILFFELERLIAKTFGVTPDRASKLLLTLVRMNVLLTDLNPPLTTPHPAQHLLDKLSALKAETERSNLLRRLIEGCKAFDAAPEADGKSFADLLQLARLLAPAVTKDPLQVDSVMPLIGATVNARIGLQAARVAEVLLRLSPMPQGPQWLRKLRELFITRHGIWKDVPLERFLADVSIDAFVNDLPIEKHPRDATLLRLAATCLQTKRLSVEIDDALLERLQTWVPEPEFAPVSIELAISVQAASIEDIDSGGGTIVVAPIVGSRQAGRMVGRFADIIDVEENLRELGRLEKKRSGNDLVFAEIVYQPTESRLGNVVTRPAIRDTEITINTLSGQAADKAIGLRDLVLGIRKGKFALFGRDGRQVIPCAGHMLNTLGAPPVVRFLSELPFDGLPMLSTFSWGTAEAFPRLPRVIWNQAILRLAQWRPSAQTLRTAAGVQEWREAWNVPRRLYMAHLDNWLLVDLDRTDHVSEIIAEAAKTDEPLTFHEAIPDTCDAWVPSTSGRHGAELVIPLIKAQPAPEGQTRSNYISAPSRLRFRPPGGDWLYLHLYARLDDHASVVAGPVLDFATHFVESKIATDWFFVRYADPEPHIRLRLHGEPEALSRGLCRLREWADMLIEARTCSRISLETYDREIERYGGVEGIEICEKIFAADSVAVARLLSRQPVRAAEADLMRLAVVSTDALLELARSFCGGSNGMAQPTQSPRSGDRR